MDVSLAAPSLIPLAEARFVAFLGVPVLPDGKIATTDHDARCQWCCHWSHPLTVEPRTYAWHVQHHQRGVPLA